MLFILLVFGFWGRTTKFTSAVPLNKELGDWRDWLLAEDKIKQT